MIAIIKTEAQYKEVLERVTALAAEDPITDSNEGRELEVLSILLQEYENRVFPLAAPSPLAAIRLRIDQQGLGARDLVPFLGSRSKVSEVMSGKRPLSLRMIRNLHSGLGIPLESLISDEPSDPIKEDIEWERFPIREMIRRGWLNAHNFRAKGRVTFAQARELMEDFFHPIGGPAMALGVLHKTDHVRTARSSDRYALAAWACFVQRRAESVELGQGFRPADWNDEGLRELRSLSRFDVGPRLAIQYLEDRGIIVDIVPHLPRTRLDGGALLRRDGAPIIALTVRHDRLDNFWFTLFHELIHVLRHLWRQQSVGEAPTFFLDDLDVVSDVSSIEREADAEARDALVPRAQWDASAVKFAVAPATVAQLAREIGVAEAIVAGRVRHETGNYRLLSSMIGTGTVRQLFPETSWPSDTK